MMFKGEEEWEERTYRKERERESKRGEKSVRGEMEIFKGMKKKKH